MEAARGPRPAPSSEARWDGEPVFVIFNPAAGRGRGARLVEPLLRALREKGVLRVEHAVTAQPGDELALARQALARGFKRIAAVGGDGTWSNTAAAILGSDAPAQLGLVPGGSGCDLAKSLGIPRDPEACASVVAAGHARAIDVGRVEGRHFLNVAGFGFDIAVIEDSRSVRWPAGGLVYLYCALRQLRAFPGFTVEMAEDGQEPASVRDLLMLIVANGRMFGGGFRIAPAADLSDGRLDRVCFGNMGLRRRARCLVRLLRGTHAHMPEVFASRGASFRLRFPSPPAYETDGEWNRARSTELTVETVPAALRVLVPAP